MTEISPGILDASCPVRESGEPVSLKEAISELEIAEDARTIAARVMGEAEA